LFDSPARWAGVAGWVDGAKESPGGVTKHHLHPNPRGYNRMAYCQGDAISHNVCSTPPTPHSTVRKLCRGHENFVYDFVHVYEWLGLNKYFWRRFVATAAKKNSAENINSHLS